jgi:hypothetical protein
MAGVLAALVLLAASAAQVAGASASTVDSGARGVVTIGPTCPVQRVGDPNCADRPYAAALKVVRARDHSLVKKFSSRSDGRFVVHLRRGRYLIEKAGSGSLPSLAPVSFSVARHRYTRVAVRFDSGLR